MLCDECKKNEATYHSIKKINGATTEKHLCSECHHKTSNTSFVGFGGADSTISDLFANFANYFGRPSKPQLACKTCGTTSKEFLETGFLGCADCYEYLEEDVAPVIQKVQSAKSHVGKVPLSLRDDISAVEYEELKHKLANAIEKEDFEEAMVIRDRMRKLRGE